MYELVSNLICCFQRAFDQHDWLALRACLDDELFIDYSSFRGTDPVRVLADDYVELRRQALSELVMQHNHSNLMVSQRADDHASASCNYQIYGSSVMVIGTSTRSGPTTSTWFDVRTGGRFARSLSISSRTRATPQFTARSNHE